MKLILLLSLLLTSAFANQIEEQKKASEDEVLTITDEEGNSKEDSLLSRFLSLGDDSEEISERTQKTIKIATEDEADVFCEEAFETPFFWWGCEEDLAGHEYNETVFNTAFRLAKRGHWEIAKAMVMLAQDKYIDTQAYEFMLMSVKIGQLHRLVAVMADKEFNHGWLKYCNSRTGLNNILNPIGSARTFNQGNILNCVHILADEPAGGWRKKAMVKLCGRHSAIVERNVCLKETLDKH